MSNPELIMDYGASTEPRSETNPYAPPSAFSELYSEEQEREELLPADRSTRFGARLLDNLILLAALSPGFFVFFAWLSPSTYRTAADRVSTFQVGLVLCGILCLGVLSYQWYLITTSGQSLGKKWLGIRIVKMNGDPPGFVHGVLLRSWVMFGLGAIPSVGGILSLVDSVMIFGGQRRCLHDKIAGTRVVLALPRL